jgi:hypothetical protein
MARYWFRQKSFGYGATPKGWQGWVFAYVSAGLVLGVILGADFLRDNTMRLMLIAAGLPIVLVPTLVIAHAKTEGGWRWRNEK